MNLPWTFRLYDLSYRIYTDASKYGFGYASHPYNSRQQIERSKKIPRCWQDEDGFANLDHTPMHYLELKAIELAVENCPERCNLLIYTDSDVSHTAINKGVIYYDNDGHHKDINIAQMIIDKIQATLAVKQISLVLRRVPSVVNPADYPSRHPCKALEKEDQVY